MDIIGQRKRWYTISGVMVGLAIATIAVFGLRLSIDFTGGSQIEVAIGNTNEPALEQLWDTTFPDLDASFTTTIEGDAIMIKTANFSDDDQRIWRDALEGMNAGAEIEQVTTIGPTVGAVFFDRAVWAVGLALLSILIFTAIAFRKASKGVSPFLLGTAALVALAHDVIIIIGVFALFGAIFGLEIDALFITAVLTVLGFSVNDTLVIFDRIRENISRMKKSDTYNTVANKSILQSATRSIHTSGSTLIVLIVLCIAFVGFDDLFFFFVALSLGVIVGTYSSLFIATPLTVSWHDRFQHWSDSFSRPD